MSLPKRDGVNDRYYLIHKPDTSPEVLAEADLCIQDVLNGTARENHSAYPLSLIHIWVTTAGMAHHSSVYPALKQGYGQKKGTKSKYGRHPVLK